MELTRREALAGGMMAAAGAAIPGLASAEQALGPDRLEVPAALAPKVYTTERVGISKATHDEHLRLYQGYARKTNEIRQKLTQAAALEAPSQIYSEMRALKVNYAFAYGGFINHLVYFETIGGEGGDPTGETLRRIKASYGTMDAWRADMKATGIAGRGWVFVGLDHMTGRIFNYIGDAQDTFPMWDHSLILALDVYEHAYYLDFKSNRGAYIDAWLKVIDWKAVEARLQKGLA